MTGSESCHVKGSGGCLRMGRVLGVAVECGCYEQLLWSVGEAAGGAVEAVEVAGVG